MPETWDVLSCHVYCRRVKVGYRQNRLLNRFLASTWLWPWRFCQTLQWWIELYCPLSLNNRSLRRHRFCRLLYLSSHAALITEFGLTQSKFGSTLYFKKQTTSWWLEFLLATQVDNYIYCGSPDAMSLFETFLQKNFDVRKPDRHWFIAVGCEIDQSLDRSIIITQSTKTDNIDFTWLQAHRSNKRDVPASPANLQAFRQVLGQMLYICKKTYPSLLYHTSAMATKTSDLNIHHLKELYSILSPTSTMTPTPSYKLTGGKGKFTLDRYCDALLGRRLSNPYDGRLGLIIFRRCGDNVHPLHWGAHKLCRVARSSATAECLAAAETADFLIYLQELLKEFYYTHSDTNGTNSKVAFELSTTIREPTEPLNEVGLATVWKTSRSSILSTIQSCPGSHHAADVLTKNNHTVPSRLHWILHDGIYSQHTSELARHYKHLTVDRGLATFCRINATSSCHYFPASDYIGPCFLVCRSA